VRLYRVTRLRDVPAAAIDGVGASSSPGRWNERNRRAVYLASRIALGLLELIVQAGTTSLHGYVAYPVDVPDDVITRLDRGRLGPHWRTMLVGRTECRRLAEEWRASGASLGLLVPSAVIPEAYGFEEFNVVLDPAHHDFARVTLGDPVPLAIDDRLAALVAPPPVPAARIRAPRRRKRPK
jgi:RES domain-containing protein